MKRAITLLTLLFGTFLLSGCVGQHTDVNIQADGTTDVTQIILLSEEVTKQAKEDGEDIQGLLIEEFNKETNEQMTIEPIEVEGQAGIELTQTFDSIESAFQSEFFVTETTSPKSDKVWTINEDHTTFAQFVSIQGSVDFYKWFAGELEMNEEEIDLMSSVAENVKLKYSITTPTKAKHHNADEVDGRTHTWLVESGETKEFILEYHTLKTKPVLYAVGLLIVLLVAIGIIVRQLRK